MESEQQMMTFQQFMERAIVAEPYRTRGRAIHNLLWDVRRDLAICLDGSNVDPIQDDRRIEACLDWLESEW